MPIESPRRRRHRRHRPLPHRPRVQGLPARPAPRRPRRHHRPGRPGQGARSSTRPSIDDLYLGCGLPGGEQGFNMARVVAMLLGLDRLPGATVTRYCASSLQTTRMAFHAIKAGEGDVFISAGVECVSRYARGSSDGAAARGAGAGRRRLAEPASSPSARARSGARAAGGAPVWTRPARGRRAARHLPGHGADRGEPGPGRTTSPARTWTSSAYAARTSPRRRSPTASGPARSPR